MFRKLRMKYYDLVEGLIVLTVLVLMILTAIWKIAL